jgi:hypothetical protein
MRLSPLPIAFGGEGEEVSVKDKRLILNKSSRPDSQLQRKRGWSQ